MNRIKESISPNSSRVYLAKFAQRAAAFIPDNARMLDAGAGDSPYRAYFHRARYEATDFCKVEKAYGNISYICNLENVAIRSNSYDLIFCSQTLEHVAEPKTVLKEFFRILKPGGQLWLTAPLFYPEHEIPYDYYRYTQYGLSHLIQSAGFTIDSAEWLEGYFGTFAFQMQEAAKNLPLRIVDYKLGLFGIPLILFIGLLKFFLATLSLFFSWLDIRTKYTLRGQCKNYAVIAKKLILSEIDMRIT